MSDLDEQIEVTSEDVMRVASAYAQTRLELEVKVDRLLRERHDDRAVIEELRAANMLLSGRVAELQFPDDALDSPAAVIELRGAGGAGGAAAEARAS